MEFLGKAGGFLPFTLTPTAVNIASPCGVVTLYAVDLVRSPGGYSTFEVGPTINGPWAASINYTCYDLGVVTTYVRGNGTLILSVQNQIVDGSFFCDDC